MRHNVNKRKSPGYWTLDLCATDALKCSSGKEFREKYYCAYRAAHRNQWLNEICGHMIQIIKPKGYWNKERCQEEALKYNTKIEFRKKCYGAYFFANKNHWLSEICKHTKPFKNPNGYWNKERCREEALKYNTKKEYRKNSSWSYVTARKNNWINEICLHMEKTGNRYNKCIYAYEFPDKSVYIGLTYNIENRQRKRDLDPHDQVTKYINNTGLIPIRKQLTKYVNVDDAIKLEGICVEKYRLRGWNILNVYKTGSIGGNVVKWTYEKCKGVANRCKSRREFKLNYPGAFNAAHSKRWIDEICSHMKMAYKPVGYWTYENCKNEAIKYRSSHQFKMNCQYAWNIACKNKWIMEEMGQWMIYYYGLKI